MRSERHKPASVEAVIEKLKQLIRTPSIIELFNAGRHEDDKVENEVDYLAMYFAVSYRTIYRRLKQAGISIAGFKQKVTLDVEEVAEVYNFNEFKPVLVNIPDSWIDAKAANEPTTTAIIGISDIQYGALYNAHGANPDVWDYSKGFINDLTKQIVSKIIRDNPSEVIIALIGDLVDGENIYIGQNVVPVQDQVEAVVKLLYHLIATVGAFDVSVKVESVRGNHGRVSKYHQASSNWDSVIAYVLGQRFEVHHEHGSYENVEVNYSKGLYHSFQTMGSWNFVLTHGDTVRGVFSSGTASFNSKPIEMLMESMKLTHFRDMDALLLGHWHRFHHGELLGMQYVVNGTCYESDFVQTTLMSKESMTMTYIKCGLIIPIESVELLYLGKGEF